MQIAPFFLIVCATRKAWHDEAWVLSRAIRNDG